MTHTVPISTCPACNRLLYKVRIEEHLLRCPVQRWHEAPLPPPDGAAVFTALIVAGLRQEAKRS